MYAPVIVFTYKRLDKTIECLNALCKNRDSEKTDLIIFSDGPKTSLDIESVENVRAYLRKFCGENKSFKNTQLIISEKNKGLATSIIEGVTKVINEYGTAIVVEDDLVTAEDFLEYMNGALQYYEDDERIGSISAFTVPMNCLKHYNKDVYITRKGDCWGWATWKKYWNEVDWNVSSFEEYYSNPNMRKEFDSIGAGLDSMLCSYMKGTLDVWAVRWCYHLYRKKLLTVYPTVSRTKNIGVDGTGEHCDPMERMQTSLNQSMTQCRFEKLDLNRYLEKKAVEYEIGYENVVVRIVNKVRNLISK